MTKLLTVVPLLACLAALAACGGSQPKTATTADDSRALKLARCLREHGIDAPDPKPGDGGSLNFKIGGGGAPDPSRLNRALSACRRYAPAGGAAPAGQQQQFADGALKYARCMRRHGVDFPDPQQNGNGPVLIGPGPNSNIDPSSPRVRRADKACRGLLPGAGATPVPAP